ASGASRRGASRARRRSGRSPAPPSTCASSSPPCGTDRSPLRASDEELANPRRTPENDVKRPLDARSPIAAESAGSRPTLPAAILLAPVAADGLSGGRSATFCNGLFSRGCPLLSPGCRKGFGRCGPSFGTLDPPMTDPAGPLRRTSLHQLH